jgi:Adenine specific DNA methylase Mod
MNHLTMKSTDLTQVNINKIAELFPNVITEARDEQGKIKRAVDFDLLKQELSDCLVEGEKERYQLTWPGKRQAILNANSPIDKTLRPLKEDSIDWDNTQNLYIEGDNLDVLKLLQESYLSKIKCIYIDPPYNTGNDFIYKDDFKESTDEYLEESGQIDEDGHRLFHNTEANGRFHSDWLTMMYSRLRIARNLLREDGTIFISIDDNEIENVKKICNEIFGEDNFIACFIWEKRTNRENRKIVSMRHDYVICYCREYTLKEKIINLLPMTDDALSRYKNPDNDPRGLWKSDPAHAQAGHGTKSQFYVLRSPNGKEHHLPSGRCWLYTQDVMEKAIQEGRIWFGQDGNGVPRIKTYLTAKERGLTPESIFFASEASTTEKAKTDLKDLFNGNAVFDTPKPVELLQLIFRIAASEGIILDFFSGSSAAAHATMQLNALDSGNRKFISVQIPEQTEETSDAFKAGYKNICEIGKERIRRAAKKIKEETGADIDYGFRVFRVDSSNMKDVYYTPDKLGQMNLDDVASNIKEDRTGEDLLIQVMLECGLELSLPMETKEIEGKTVHYVAGNSLIACFDGEVSESVIKRIAEDQPLRVVFRDSSFSDDSARINVEELFKLLSPSTEIQVL